MMRRKDKRFSFVSIDRQTTLQVEIRGISLLNSFKHRQGPLSISPLSGNLLRVDIRSTFEWSRSQMSSDRVELVLQLNDIREKRFFV